MTVVAIDGPAGAGKSTVAKAVARRLGFTYVDTGALYRTLTLAALRAGVPADDEGTLARLARDADLSFDPGGRIMLDGRDVTDEIRSAEVTAEVSQVAAHPAVRQQMLAYQRDAAAQGDVVMEGRDIATTVAPGAGVKVFLTASLEERARRRWEQNGRTGASLEEVARTIRARDEADATRASSPLERAADAVLMDTTGLSIEQVVEEIAVLVERVR